MSNLFNTLTATIEKKAELAARTITVLGSVIVQSATNRIVTVHKTEGPVAEQDKHVVTFYAMVDQKKVRITAWEDTSKFAALPGGENGYELRLVLREEGVYAPEGKEPMEQFSLVKMGTGANIEEGFRAFSELATKAESTRANTTLATLRLFTSSAFVVNKKDVDGKGAKPILAVRAEIIGMTKDELALGQTKAMVIITEEASAKLVGDGPFFEGVVFAAEHAWIQTDQHGVETTYPRLYINRGALGKTEEEAITRLHGENY